MAELNLDPNQLDRYSRHVVMDEVGPDGQARLLDSAVLVVGAGGLGSPVLAYLAAAGVGHIGIADPDVVDRSNLQRQVIHGEADVGRPKVASAAEFIEGLNPDVEVTAHDLRLEAANAESIIEAYDFVVDGSDSFGTQYLVNDACVLSGRPFAHGSVLRFEGQVGTFAGAEDDPCYRCLFPQAPPPETVEDCATAGVLGVLPGTIGCLQATEALKYLTGVGTTLSGRLLHYDALELAFETVPFDRDPDCPACGEEGIESLADGSYEGRCGIDAA